MPAVLLIDEAVLEGEEAASWYESQREGLGHEFREALGRSLEVLREGLVSGSSWPGSLGERGRQARSDGTVSLSRCLFGR